MGQIEETIFENGLPVNQIAMLKRMEEILEQGKTNSSRSLDEEGFLRWRMMLWLINYTSKRDGKPLESEYEEWLDLKKIKGK